ncbi:MAG: sigma-70 family RNA polymerase sigma factor [Planctomycetaceae bacterium]|nr:sigma-70 family RNA polymerase sigma factor [Planctomycetaceae bacterium]
MSNEPEHSHLSAMDSTRWSDVMSPQDEQLPPHIRRARLERFFHRYSKAVRKFLARLLMSHPQRSELTEECYQQFAVKFLEGRFSQCSPDESGRFRHYLKATLRNLVQNVYRQKSTQSLDVGTFEPAVTFQTDAESELETILRDDCLRTAMERLKLDDDRQGTALHRVLEIRTKSPAASYDQLASLVSESLRKVVDAGWVRKRVHFARDRLRDYIRDEVAATLSVPTSEAIDDELAVLGLHRYVART